jgi:hypothetical protein
MGFAWCNGDRITALVPITLVSGAPIQNGGRTSSVALKLSVKGTVDVVMPSEISVGTESF